MAPPANHRRRRGMEMDIEDSVVDEQAQVSPGYNSYHGYCSMPMIQTKPWQKIVEFYRSLTESNSFFQPMLTLAEQITASKYANGLYPWTSMQTLCISQTPVADSGKEALYISIDRDGTLVFDFQETAST